MLNVDVGSVIAGKYELVRLLGKGAMGEVWRAVHNTLGGEVAIKLVEPADDIEAETAAGRFQLEAQIAAKLSRRTRHIVSVSDHGEEDGLAYLVMELLEGESLEQRIKRHQSLGLADVAAMVSQVSRALVLAHEEGIFHRDIKPANLLLGKDEDGRLLVKLLDFGIARSKKPFRTRSPFTTSKDMVLGTPSYMSPEQARGLDSLDHRCDVWALAVVAYEALTSKLPFEGETLEDIFLSICTFRVVPVRVRRPDLGPEVEALFARAFAPKLDERFRSAAEFSDAFLELVTEDQLSLAIGGPLTSSERHRRSQAEFEPTGRPSDPALDVRPNRVPPSRTSEPQLTAPLGSSFAEHDVRPANRASSPQFHTTPMGGNIGPVAHQQTTPVLRRSHPDFGSGNFGGMPTGPTGSGLVGARGSYPNITPPGPITDPMNVALGTGALNRRSSSGPALIVALLALLLLVGLGAVYVTRGPKAVTTTQPPDREAPSATASFVTTSDPTAIPVFPTASPVDTSPPRAMATASHRALIVPVRPPAATGRAPIVRPAVPVASSVAAPAPAPKPIDKGNVF